MEIRQGNTLITEVDSLDDIHIGDSKPPFIYQGDELIHPNPVKDGLVLWYDFSAMSNSDVSKGVAKDLSGNGHDGTLHNFNYTNESGYVGDGLKFDGVDDEASKQFSLPTMCSFEVTFRHYTDETWSSPISSLDTINPGVGFAMTPRNNNFTVSAGDGAGRYQHIYFYMDRLPFNEWHHAVVTYDGEKFALFINGAFISAEVFNLKQSSIFALGRWSQYTSANDYRFSGDIGSSKIYSRPLTAEEIQHNYQLEKARFNL